MLNSLLQTWFPFLIQIYINGREYLAKQLDKKGICYKRHDNCFLQIDDLKRPQEIADKIESKKFGTTRGTTKVSEMYGMGFSDINSF